MFTSIGLLEVALFFALTQPVAQWRCDVDILLVGRFEDETPTQPSLGSGGLFPQRSQLSISSASGQVTYHFDVPPYYQPGRPAPLIALLHGAAGPGGQSFAAAATRDAWAMAGLGDAIVVAPESSGSQGGWIPNTDLVKLQAVLASARMRYNIDLNRIYGWGFSAGAHTMHSFALAGAPNLFAGYSVSAGALQAFAGVNAPMMAPRKVPLHVHQGINDGVVPFNIVQADIIRFQNAGWISAAVQGQNLFFESFDGGHEFESAHAARIWANLCRFAEVPALR